MKFAIIENGVVVNVALADEPMGPSWIASEEAAIGWLYHAATGALSAPPVAAEPPRIVITNVAADFANVDATVVKGNDITCPTGTTLSVTAELRVGSTVLPLTDSFRMPLKSRDGREKVLLAKMTAGTIRISVPLKDSGAWSVTQEMINADLPAEAHMAFDGLKVFVYEK